MKRFNNKIKDNMYTAWRLVSPIFDVTRPIKGIRGYFWFIRDALKFNRLNPKEKIKLSLISPQLMDKTSLTHFDAHYFYQQLWAFEKIFKSKVKRHVDVGSTFEMSGYISKITKSEFVDIRPLKVSLNNFKSVEGGIENLPYKDGELDSISCLHVIEHIGLGRYGDKVDPSGHEKAIKELQRVVKTGGSLYLSTPVGKPRLYFNAHRVFDPEYLCKKFKSMELVEFSMVNDNGEFIENISVKEAEDQDYACGMFWFKKVEKSEKK
jgi:SAM-dependent methyltransferase